MKKEGGLIKVDERIINKMYEYAKSGYCEYLMREKLGGGIEGIKYKYWKIYLSELEEINKYYTKVKKRTLDKVIDKELDDYGYYERERMKY